MKGSIFALLSFMKFTGDPAEREKVGFFRILQKPIDKSQNPRKSYLAGGSL